MIHPLLYDAHIPLSPIKVLDRHLSEKKTSCVVGNDVTIADMAIIPWLNSHGVTRVDMSKYPAMQKYLDHMLAMPLFEKCVKKEMDKMTESEESQAKLKEAMQRVAKAYES